MSGTAEVFPRRALIAPESATPAEMTRPRIPRLQASAYDEQIRSLVQRLFFHPGASHRHVGFSPADLQTDIEWMCLSIARALCKQGRYNVGLIDARMDSASVGFRIGKDEVLGNEATDIEARLWMVPRQEWIEIDPGQAITDESFTRLHRLTCQFDFSILCCGTASWLTARIGRVCDGLVLVLTANQTRRLVAQKMRQQLRAARVPLLGTVLAQRRFPVPAALYRKL